MNDAAAGALTSLFGRGDGITEPKKCSGIGTAVLFFSASLLLQHRRLNLVREDCKMAGKAIKNFSFDPVSREIADQSAFCRVLPQLLYLSLIVLHGCRSGTAFPE